MTGACFSLVFILMLALFSTILTAKFHVNVRMTYSLSLLYCKATPMKCF